MAKARNDISKTTLEPTKKGTSIGSGIIKLQTMNKHKKRSYKAYRGQGR